jgi:hypothetical protein
MHRLITKRLIAKRLIAKFLLLAALVGNLAPLALAATAAPHTCCIRKAVHHCHDSLASQSETGRLVIREASNCNHDCCRAVTTARWAQAQPSAAASFVQNIEAYLGQYNPVSPSTEPTSFQSTRAPPAC